MAKYEATNSREDAWHDENSHRRFDTRPPAEELFEAESARGLFVRLIRWDNYRLTELRRSEGRGGG